MPEPKFLTLGSLRQLVPEEGLEPSLSLQEMDFESIASANSATPAVVAHSIRRKMPFKNVSGTPLPKYWAKLTKASRLATFLSTMKCGLERENKVYHEQSHHKAARGRV